MPRQPARSTTDSTTVISASPVLSREDVNALPIRAYEGEICLVRTERELEVALNELWDETVIGFDTETRPTFTRGNVSPPALVQLAGHARVFLVQLPHMPFGEALAALLSTEHIVKAGVAIRDDMRALERLYPFEAGAVADLALMARTRGIKAQGLRTLAAQLLGFRISKSAQCSNWEKSDLTIRQIRYAATDAWVGRELYLAMK